MATSSSHRQQQLVELVDYPRENLGIEIKNWLDMTDYVVRAHVARELLALGNSGGGFLLFGFEEVDGRYSPATPPPSDLSSYGQDAMNGVIARYAEPRFEVEVEFVPRSDGQTVHPVVIVPSDLDTPIRARRDGPARQHIVQNTYYTRRPGPESSPIQTGREWDDLLDRCIRTKRELLIERIREIIQGPEALLSPFTAEPRGALDDFVVVALDRFEEVARGGLPEGFPGRYEYGIWHLAYRVVDSPIDLTLNGLRNILQQVVGHETGWPAWWLPTTEQNSPHPWEGRIECWMAAGEVFTDGSHSDYWLADRRGMLFLLRGYEDDSVERGAPADPGRYFDPSLPVWRVGECLLHAERFSRAVAADLQSASVEVKIRWNGLHDRQLSAWASPRGRVVEPRVNRGQDSVESRVVTPAMGISERLPEIVQALTQPLFEAFDFFDPAAQFFRDELDTMRGRRRR